MSGATSVTILISIGSSYVNYRTVNGDYQGIARTRLNAATSRRHRRSYAAGISPTTRRCSTG